MKHQKRTVAALVVAVVVGVGLWLTPTRGECASCGITPIKPIPPIGCRDLVPVCSCDSRGNCAYSWICVK